MSITVLNYLDLLKINFNTFPQNNMAKECNRPQQKFSFIKYGKRLTILLNLKYSA